MRPSTERTQRMEQIFTTMLGIANASYPLVDELINSPSPGERLAAVAILQVFACQQYFPFLVKLVGAEKPFVGYHATKALRFAVRAADPRVYPELQAAIDSAQKALESADVGFDTDRRTMLRDAKTELEAIMKSLAAPPSE